MRPARATPAFRSRRGIGLVYLLSGLVSSVAAIVYVAHLGQAKSDAGTGYELDAITAVVLGRHLGVWRTRDHWRHAARPFFARCVAERFAPGCVAFRADRCVDRMLLVATIGIDRFRARSGARQSLPEGEIPVKNSQVAVLCGAILAGALIVAGTNVWLVRSFGPRRRRRGSTARQLAHRPVIAMMPKAKGDPYFVSCRKGAEEAARELGVDLIWDGPTSLDAAKQNEIVESWITRQVDVIAVAVENQAGISTVLRKAREHGIRVLTWDADAEPDARDFFVNQATARRNRQDADRRGRAAARAAKASSRSSPARSAPPIRTNGSSSSASASRRSIPDLKLATIRPSDDDRDKAFAETQTIVKVFPHEAGDGDFGARSSRRGRGGSPSRTQGRGRHRAFAAEHLQALYS